MDIENECSEYEMDLENECLVEQTTFKMQKQQMHR